MTGHSLGAAVCTLLGLFLSTPRTTYQRYSEPSSSDQHNSAFVTNSSSGLPAGRPVHVYAFGPAAAVSSDLAKYSVGLVTSLVHNKDIVPSLSLGTLRDLKAMAVTLYDEKNLAEDIIAKVVGIHRKRQVLGSTVTAPLSINGPSTSSQTQVMKLDNSNAVRLRDEADLDDWYYSLYVVLLL